MGIPLRAILVLSLLPCLSSRAAGPVPVKTLMTERGKLLLSADFDQPPGKGWLKNKGKWDTVDGVLRGAELKSDMHAAVLRYPLSFHNVVIHYSFKLDGAKATTLSMNGAKGHICRVIINAKGFSLKKDKDKDKKNPADKGAILSIYPIDIKPGVWHNLTVEIQGKEMLAILDGEKLAYGAHDGIDVTMANFGFTIAGDGVCFKNLRVWEASPNSSWPTTRSKLIRP